jgi:hypothetical protein
MFFIDKNAITIQQVKGWQHISQFEHVSDFQIDDRIDVKNLELRIYFNCRKEVSKNEYEWYENSGYYNDILFNTYEDAVKYILKYIDEKMKFFVKQKMKFQKEKKLNATNNQ